jgi:deoxyribodipyrimidine photo-lyase
LLMSGQVLEFRRTLAADVWPDADVLHSVEDVSAWAQEHGLDQIITPHATVGPVRSLLNRARKAGAPLTQIRREIDTTAWPLATAGFFKFRKHIPDLLDQFAR